MRRPLRVAMVHYSAFRLDSRIQRQARALAERGDRVELVCLGEAETIAVGAGSIRVHPVPMDKPVGGAGSYLHAYAAFFAHAARRITALSRSGLDLVEAHNMPDFLTLTALIPKLRGTPVILNAHDTFPELFTTKFARRPDDAAVRLIRLEERVSARFANHVITVTEEARERMCSRGVPHERSSVVMNSPDERVFGPQREPVRDLGGDPVRVLYHGGLAERFGVETLIRAVAALDGPGRRVTLRVCGSGEDRDRLAALAAELAAERVDVAADPVPFEAIPAELERAHIGVVPTLHDSFTELLLPVKLLEYVHMGLPVLASDLPGISRYFGPRDLWRFAPGSPDSLATALRALLADPAEARRRAQGAAQRLREIAWEQQKTDYLALVDRLVDEANAAQRSRAAHPAPAAASAAG